MTIASDHAAASVHRHWPDLDGIRGVLALGVVALHYGINAAIQRAAGWHGFIFDLGVDIFFVMSGFVLTASFLASSRRSVGQFAVKRVLRLAPVFYATAAVALFVPAASYDYALAPAELAMAVPLLGQNPANFPAWSITWEFYLPIAAVALASVVARLRPLRLALLVLALAGLAWADVQVAQGGHLYFLRGMLGLAAGCCLYNAFPPRPGTAPRPALTYALLVMAFAVMGLASEAPLAAIALPPIAAALVWSGAWQTTPLLNSRPAQYLGAVSYTLYMVHIPVLFTLRAAFGSAIDGNPLAKVVALGLSLGLAALLTRFVELPAMRLGRRWADRARKG